MTRSIRIYIEGGGDHKTTKQRLRLGFQSFFKGLNAAARARHIEWNVIVCGSRERAYDSFKIALETHPQAFNVLLVDSEAPVADMPWAHLKKQDRWESCGLDDAHCHLMVQTMEAWLVADRQAMSKFYGKHFQEKALPPGSDVEEIAKTTLETALKKATQATKKGAYHKIDHGASLLELIDARKVRAAARHCDRLFNTMERLIG